jgi:hypothetical protein
MIGTLLSQMISKYGPLRVENILSHMGCSFDPEHIALWRDKKQLPECISISVLICAGKALVEDNDPAQVYTYLSSEARNMMAIVASAKEPALKY